MMMLEIEMLALERHERMQREAALANAARRLGAGRRDHVNRPNRLRFLSRS